MLRRFIRCWRKGLPRGRKIIKKIIIRLKDRMDKESLNSSLSLSSYTRQAAHALAVEALKNMRR